SRSAPPSADAPHELVLQVDERRARLVAIAPRPLPVRAEPPRGGALVHREVEELLDLIQVLRSGEAHERLDAAVEVAVHHVGAADVDDRVAVVLEAEHARVLEVATEDAAHADVLAQSLDARLEGADAAHPDIHRDAGLARAVQAVDDRLVDHRVDLD